MYSVVSNFESYKHGIFSLSIIAEISAIKQHGYKLSGTYILPVYNFISG